MRTIKLTQGLVATVDDADYPALSLTKWTACRCGVHTIYAVRHARRPEGGYGRIYMHRQLLAAPDGEFVDHRDGNGLNNTRANLRLCDRFENAQNAVSRTGRSRFKGVSWHERAGKWQVHVAAAGDRSRYVGLYDDEIEAARAYDARARELHGEFARLNFPITAKEVA